jgi:hypothetical protein
MLELYTKIITYKGERKIEDGNNFKRLVALSGSSEPINIINTYIKNMGETPSYLWKKKEILSLEVGIKNLYYKKIISYSSASRLSKIFKKKEKETLELITKIGEESLNKIELIREIELIENATKKYSIPAPAKDVKKVIAKFRRVNRVIKEESLSEDAVQKINTLISSVNKVIRDDTQST